MAAFAGVGVPRPRRLLVRLRAATRRMELDRHLAMGADPGSTPELACRAHVLAGWRMRHALAAGLEQRVAEAVAPPRREGAAAPIVREEVRIAQEQLLRLAAALRAEPAPHVRGIAEASRLLTDGRSPMFVAGPAGTLREAAMRAAFHAEAG